MFPTTRMRFDEVESTNDLGRQWSGSIGHGSLLITAQHQTRGRGRRGAQWHDCPGTSALMTYVVEAPVPISDAWKLSFAASLAARDACANVTCADIGIEWPNDIVFANRKVGGILIETVPLANTSWIAIIGIGVNVLQSDFSEKNPYPVAPISIQEIVTDRLPDVESMVSATSSALGPLLDLVGTTDGWATLVTEWMQHLIIGGSQAGLDDDGELVTGVLDSVDAATGRGLLILTDGARVFARPVERGTNG